MPGIYAIFVVFLNYFFEDPDIMIGKVEFVPVIEHRDAVGAAGRIDGKGDLHASTGVENPAAGAVGAAFATGRTGEDYTVSGHPRMAQARMPRLTLQLRVSGAAAGPSASQAPFAAGASPAPKSHQMPAISPSPSRSSGASACSSGPCWLQPG